MEFLKEALPRKEKEFDDLRKAEVNFLGRASWRDLLKGSSSTISERT
jgi:hypothetical protein